MGLGALGTTADDMDEEWQRIASAAKGADVLRPKAYTKSDMEKAASAVDEARKAYKDKMNGGTAGTLAVASAASRDLPYCSCGRKYMLVAGMTRKSLAMVARGRMIGRFETRTEG